MSSFYNPLWKSGKSKLKKSISLITFNKIKRRIKQMIHFTTNTHYVEKSDKSMVIVNVENFRIKANY